jgi:hypothetical protein
MDQVAWANANVLIGAAREPHSRGSLLPEPATAEEAADRQTLRLIGALRVVEVIYTPEELADQARAQGAATAARESAADVDPSLPLGEQVAGSADPGPPVLTGAGGAPVVIGDEDLKAEHDKQARAADKTRRAAREEEAKDEAPAEPEPAQHRQGQPGQQGQARRR